MLESLFGSFCQLSWIAMICFVSVLDVLMCVLYCGLQRVSIE